MEPTKRGATALDRLQARLEGTEGDRAEGAFTAARQAQREQFWTEETGRILRDELPAIAAALPGDFSSRDYQARCDLLASVVGTFLLDYERKTGRLVPARVREVLLRRFQHNIAGLGAIQTLLEDPDVSDILVNGRDAVFVEKKGRLHRCDGRERDRDGVPVLSRTEVDRKRGGFSQPRLPV